MSTTTNTREIGIIMNGVSGRMGYRQHLLQSIRDEGGVELSNGSRLTVRPLLVGCGEQKLADLAATHGIADYMVRSRGVV